MIGCRIDRVRPDRVRPESLQERNVASAGSRVGERVDIFGVLGCAGAGCAELLLICDALDEKLCAIFIEELGALHNIVSTLAMVLARTIILPS
jgi:hypothetical protein